MFIFSPFKATKKVKKPIVKVWCCLYPVDLLSSKAREHETDIHLYNLQPFKSVSDRNENNGDGDSIAFIQYIYIYICFY
jgi:hypothetical protein